MLTNADYAAITIGGLWLMIFVMIILPVIGSAIFWLFGFGIPMAAIHVWFGFTDFVRSTIRKRGAENRGRKIVVRRMFVTLTILAFVVHCSSPRFSQAFDTFIKDLGITHPIRIIVPGSVSSVGAGVEMVLSKQFKVLKDQIEMLVEEHPHMTPRFVLINHEDCRGYAHIEASHGRILQRIAKYSQVLEKQEIDLKLAAGIVNEISRRYLNGASVELYMARIADGKVRFDTIVDTRNAAA